VSKTSELSAVRAARKRRFIPAVEVAKQRKVSRRTVYAWCKKGILAVEVEGRVLRILRAPYERQFPRRPSVYDLERGL
jgi:hypothetical protein